MCVCVYIYVCVILPLIHNLNFSRVPEKSGNPEVRKNA